MDYLRATLELKAVAASQRIISGYAAGIGNQDRVQDVILPGAFTKTLASKAPGDVAVFIGHKTDSLPVGIPLVIQETPQGLYTETLIKPGPAGDDLLATAEFLQRHGRALGMSIGYRVPPGGARMSRGADGKTVRELAAVDLHEYSFAASQSIANPAALVSSVKQTEAPVDDETKAVWDTAYMNDLPDSAFLFIESGGVKDDEGKTTPRSKRHFPYRDAEGQVDLPHLRNAIARIPQSDAPGLDKAACQGRARRMLASMEGGKTVDLEAPEWQAGIAARIVGAGETLAQLGDRVAEAQAAMRTLGEDTKQYQRIPPAERAELREVAALLRDWATWGDTLDAGREAAAQVARLRRELDLLDLAAIA